MSIYDTRTMMAVSHFTVTYRGTKRQGKTHFCVVPSRELSDSTHSKFRQAHLAPFKRLIIRVRQADNNGGAHAGSGRVVVGGSLARAEARTRERHHPSGGEECRHDRRSGDGVAGRNPKNVQGQRWSPLQRNGRPLGEPHSRHEPIVPHGVNNPVSALHNLLAAVQ